MPRSNKSGKRHGGPSGIRIISGQWRGRRISLAASASARPTPDRVRETLFNWLGPAVEGARCLDLYAGSGILGLEALSRGAAQADFVESDRGEAAAINTRLQTFGSERGFVHCLDVRRFLDREAVTAFDIVFVDPPYSHPLAEILDALVAWLAPGASVYAERSDKDGLPAIGWGHWKKSSRAGAVAFGLASPGPAPQ